MLASANYHHTDGYERLAVPIAQTCFSLLDILGFLHRPGANISSENLKQTNLNISNGLDLFLPVIKQNQRDILIDYFRNGVMHLFLPYLGAEIKNDNLGLEIMAHIGKRHILNVNPFAKALIASYKNYTNNKNNLIHSKFNDIAFGEFLSQNVIKGEAIQYSSSTASSSYMMTRPLEKLG